MYSNSSKLQLIHGGSWHDYKIINEDLHDTGEISAYGEHIWTFTQSYIPNPATFEGMSQPGRTSKTHTIKLNPPDNEYDTLSKLARYSGYCCAVYLGLTLGSTTSRYIWRR